MVIELEGGPVRIPFAAISKAKLTLSEALLQSMAAGRG